MGINLSVYGKQEYVQKFREISQSILPAITHEMQTQMTELADYVRRNKLSGDPLNRRSGRLSRSINGQAFATGNVVTGVVGSKNVPYAHVHEDGGTFDIPLHTRLISQVFGRPIVPKQIWVSQHSATFPQRAFLKPSLKENEDKIKNALRLTVLDIMGGN